MTIFRSVRADAGLAERRISHEQVIAFAITALLAVRVTYKDFPIGTLVAIALLPVTVQVLRKYRGAALLAGLSAAAAASGVVLAYVNAQDHQVNVHRMLSGAFLILGLGICLITLLWARSVIGAVNVALGFGVGALASVAIGGVNDANIWKFSLSVPITLILLSLPVVARTVTRQVLVMLAITAFSGIADSRSLAATLLIATALLITRRSPGSKRRPSTWLVVVQLVMIGVGVFLTVQSIILEGIFGAEIQSRTELQIQNGGNIFTGGRPEMGATLALLRFNPFGFGAGVTPSYQDITVAKTGMSKLGYDPQNGYVNHYMFGSGFEVHSLLGDLWLLAGIAGLVFAIVVIISVISGMAHSIGHGAALGVALFLGARSIWDFFFSPLGSTYFTIALCLALLLPEARRIGGDRA